MTRIVLPCSLMVSLRGCPLPPNTWNFKRSLDLRHESLRLLSVSIELGVVVAPAAVGGLREGHVKWWSFGEGGRLLWGLPTPTHPPLQGVAPVAQTTASPPTPTFTRLSSLRAGLHKSCRGLSRWRPYTKAKTGVDLKRCSCLGYGSRHTGHCGVEGGRDGQHKWTGGHDVWWYHYRVGSPGPWPR